MTICGHEAYDRSGISTLRQYLAEAAAHQLAADLELPYDARGPRDEATVRRLDAPQQVDRARWERGGLPDAWVFSRRDGGWIGRVRGADGTTNWLPQSDLRLNDGSRS
jgi:hypothetical protein